MSEAMTRVMQRRAELLGAIAAQRTQVAQAGAALKTPVAIAETGWSVFHYLRAHPVLTAGVTALLMTKRRRARGWLGKLWGVWRGYRALTGLATKWL